MIEDNDFFGERPSFLRMGSMSLYLDGQYASLFRMGSMLRS
jgi:hypothetical protein